MNYNEDSKYKYKQLNSTVRSKKSHYRSKLHSITHPKQVKQPSRQVAYRGGSPLVLAAEAADHEGDRARGGRCLSIPSLLSSGVPLQKHIVLRATLHGQPHLEEKEALQLIHIVQKMKTIHENTSTHNNQTQQCHNNNNNNTHETANNK